VLEALGSFSLIHSATLHLRKTSDSSSVDYFSTMWPDEQVNFIVPRDFGGGLDFLAKATVPRPAYCKAKATKFGFNAKAKD